MINYEILGWSLPTCDVAVGRLLQVADKATAGVEKYCIEAHFQDPGAMRVMASVLPSERYACFCWKRVEEVSEFLGEEFNTIGEARFTFADKEVTIRTRPATPIYDWDGLPSREAQMAYAEKHPQPVPRELFQPNQRTVFTLAELLGAALRPGLRPEIKTSSSWAGGCRHSYLFKVDAGCIPSILIELFRRFGLQHGTGSFEFFGSGECIEKLASQLGYSLDNFPIGTWSFNGGYGKTPFALERQSFLYPVLNVRADQLPSVAALIDALGDRVPRCSLLRKYVAWNLGAGSVSPRTQDNYVMLSKQKVGWRMFVGFEQYADEDPPAKQFTVAVAPLLESMGARLKRVPYIK